MQSNLIFSQQLVGTSTFVLYAAYQLSTLSNPFHSSILLSFIIASFALILANLFCSIFSEVVMRLKPSLGHVLEDPLAALAFVCRNCQLFGPVKLMGQTDNCSRCDSLLDVAFNLQLSVIDSRRYKDYDLGSKVGDRHSPEEFRHSQLVQAEVLETLKKIVSFTSQTTELDLSNLL